MARSYEVYMFKKWLSQMAVPFYTPSVSVVVVCFVLITNNVDHIFSGNISVQIFCSFFKLGFCFLLLSFESSMYTLDIIPLQNTYTENNLFHYIAYLLVS